MTIAEMHIALDNRVDKLATASYPDLLPEQKDLELNEAILIFAKLKYGRNNVYRQGFQEIQKRTDDLNTLVKNIYLIPTVVTLDPKVYKVNIQGTLADGNEYMFYLRGNMQVSSEKCAAKYVGAKLVQIDDLDSVLSDPFNKPTINEPVISFEDGGIYIYADSTFNVNNFKLTYLKIPRKVSIFDNVNSDLPPQTHDEIISIAAERIIERIESPRLQTTVQQNNKIE